MTTDPLRPPPAPGHVAHIERIVASLARARSHVWEHNGAAATDSELVLSMALLEPEYFRSIVPPSPPAEAPQEAMRQALLGTAAWTLEDGTPCWCGPCPPIEEDGDEHMPECLAARSALSLGDEGERIQREAHERLLDSPDCGGLYANPPPAASEAVPKFAPWPPTPDEDLGPLLREHIAKHVEAIFGKREEALVHLLCTALAGLKYRLVEDHSDMTRTTWTFVPVEAPAAEASVERLVKAATMARNFFRYCDGHNSLMLKDGLLYAQMRVELEALDAALSAFGAAEGGER